MTHLWTRYVDFWREKEAPDMLALIFAIQTLCLVLVLKERKIPALGFFWLSLILTLAWFAHHATDPLEIAL